MGTIADHADSNPVVEETRRAMRKILDADLPSDGVPLPQGLRQLARVRSAARRALEREGLTDRERADLLLPLTRAVEDAVLADWARRAILDELSEWAGDDRPPLPTMSLELAAERLRAAGYRKCPTCLFDVLSEIEVKDLQGERRAWDELQELAELRRENTRRLANGSEEP